MEEHNHSRFPRLDALRALAIVWMAAFHFAYDLDHFRFIDENFRTDWFWTSQRTAIVSLFLFCAGMGQAVALEQGQPWSRFWRRWAQVAGCALLVSFGSYLMFPRSFIYFGILHGIAVMLLVTRLTVRWQRALWLAGLVAVVLPHLYSHPFFDTRVTNWVGLVTRKPVTEDYVPLLPWVGVMWWGMAAGKWLLRRRRAWLAGPLPAGMQPLATLGRWSLSFYMVHQPLFIGLLATIAALQGRGG
jgi:uncharacterized membrane protein